MKVHTLTQIQEIPISIEQAWEFFSSPGNLKHITPSYMGFKITSGDPEPMFEGQEISYVVKPLLSIPMRWRSRISKVNNGRSFIDEQVQGPYRHWSHSHYFEPVPGGVRMTDLVSYRLPLGWFGELIHKFFIRKRLEDIFRYRRFALMGRFGRLQGN